MSGGEYYVFVLDGLLFIAFAGAFLVFLPDILPLIAAVFVFFAAAMLIEGICNLLLFFRRIMH